MRCGCCLGICINISTLFPGGICFPGQKFFPKNLNSGWDDGETGCEREGAREVAGYAAGTPRWHEILNIKIHTEYWNQWILLVDTTCNNEYSGNSVKKSLLFMMV